MVEQSLSAPQTTTATTQLHTRQQNGGGNSFRGNPEMLERGSFSTPYVVESKTKKLSG